MATMNLIIFLRIWETFLIHALPCPCSFKEMDFDVSIVNVTCTYAAGRLEQLIPICIGPFHLFDVLKDFTPHQPQKVLIVWNASSSIVNTGPQRC